MGRPVRIHKKKSFMFTTKHHSFSGCMSGVIGIIAIAVITAMAIASYSLAGDVDVGFGGVGLFCLILNIIGIISGCMGLKERDAFKAIPIFGTASNAVMVLAWAGLIIISQIQGRG